MRQHEELVIGVDIGGTNTAIGLVNAQGECIQTSIMDTRPKDDPSLFVRRLYKEIELLRGRVSSENVFVGIGIACPAANSYTGAIEHPANFNWGRIDFVRMMKQYLALPIAMTNDGNAAALGEMEYGAARGMRDFMVITLGTGVGSGIVVDRRLLLGQHGWAGELGHVIVEPEGRECGCGRMGCLETYVSAPGICRTAFELLARRNTESGLRRINFHDLTSEAICAFALQGDSIAIEAFNLAGSVLGKWLANAAAIFDPEAFILFGGVANGGDVLFNPVRLALESNLMDTFKGKIQVLGSHLQKRQAGVLGASVLIFRPECSPVQETSTPRSVPSSIA